MSNLQYLIENNPSQNPEVIQSLGQVARLNHEDLDGLIELAEQNERKRIRVNFHQAPDSVAHEMVIVHKLGAYVAPHKHSNKTESFHIIKGKLAVLVFDDEGTVHTKILLSATEEPGHGMFYRLEKNQWHTVIPLTDYVIFHEVTNGPFIANQYEFAPWAPLEDDDRALIKEYQLKLSVI